ncbi:MAG: hypothetical protein M9952_12770 [Microthrixaceae bacterium]|nr:hypothetical protein [Microthrixaceae bacterium]
MSIDSDSAGEVLDSMGAMASLFQAPAAIRATIAAAGSAGVPEGLEIGAVVLAASQRSALTAKTVGSIAAQRVQRPVIVNLGEPLPVWLGSRSLVVALDDAAANEVVSDDSVAGVPVIAIGAQTERRPNPLVETAAALVALAQFDIAPGLLDDLIGAADLVESRLEEWVADKGPARRLARRIGRTLPLVYGAGPVGAAAAASWKFSVNRNAKAPAYWNAVPGVDFDEVCGWAQHGDVTRQVFTLAVLRSALETDDQRHRLDVTAETCEEIVAGVHPVDATATTDVGVLFELMAFGEMVSLHMADIADIDPGPTPVLGRY